MNVISGALNVRPLEDKDKYTLSRWLSNPEVLEFYEGRDRPFTIQLVEEKFLSDRGVMSCLVEYEGNEVGYLQYYQLDHETMIRYGYTNLDEVIYGTDQFIGETEYWNKGVGTQLIRAVVEYLLQKEGVHRLVMDPMTWNTRAIRCYEKCGYSKARILREHELHEGKYHDAWLMEFIPE
ncbi:MULTISPECIES: GNAT family N-acetyltransferase [Bacillaceae]|uniref:GNAT family N-acetyltransferase n=1 Tax=Bacillaceae TaxID=186817 RepID=UPI001C594E42|nr:GNAT family N-acetyltransferase [Rossellomorea sp. YZS02]MBW3110779.1 acetyltransferase [Bacillus sp. MCCB 382]MDX8343305.1 GNAT family N-acetyltransferase [Rossellomorea sp. YZS02]